MKNYIFYHIFNKEFGIRLKLINIKSWNESILLISTILLYSK